MLLHIHHTTRYDYDASLRLSTQVLRLTPRLTPGQSLRSWRLDLPGRAVAFKDAWGNAAHLLTLDGLRREIILSASGSVETSPQAEPEADADLPPEVFLRGTPLTEADQAIADFAGPFRDHLPNVLAMVPRLASEILARMPYVQGNTDVATGAPQAFAAGSGVCQDHAHVLISCLRWLGVPSRYVSGYLATDTEHVASHAWVEFRSASGWLGFDVSNQRWADGHHVRLAYGADYLEACPIRGMRIGGGVEQLSIFVRVSQDQ